MHWIIMPCLPLSAVDWRVLINSGSLQSLIKFVHFLESLSMLWYFIWITKEAIFQVSLCTLQKSPQTSVYLCCTGKAVHSQIPNCHRRGGLRTQEPDSNEAEKHPTCENPRCERVKFVFYIAFLVDLFKPRLCTWYWNCKLKVLCESGNGIRLASINNTES